ncbi:MAG: hypothetical protein SFV54_03600 [Bryobacteraceae bacterium]|nr:hypothetical protein [Bryobacteraceae bacterium]
MAKRKIPGNAAQKRKKTDTPVTRGKNAAGQTNGQFEQDPKRRSGNFEAAGEAPRMIK